MEPHVITYLIFGLIAILLTLWNVSTERKLRRFMRGKSGQTLEGTITDMLRSIESINTRLDDTNTSLSDIDARVKVGVRRATVRRFNPFGSESGGNQSFAIALVDENGDGVVLSSLYARDKMRVYAKPVSKYASSYDLTDEERAVLVDSKKR